MACCWRRLLAVGWGRRGVGGWVDWMGWIAGWCDAFSLSVCLSVSLCLCAVGGWVGGWVGWGAVAAQDRGAKSGGLSKCVPILLHLILVHARFTFLASSCPSTHPPHTKATLDRSERRVLCFVCVCGKRLSKHGLSLLLLHWRRRRQPLHRGDSLFLRRASSCLMPAPPTPTGHIQLALRDACVWVLWVETQVGWSDLTQQNARILST